ncbi:MAG TPA: TolC family protein [Thermoanaerobaculia bacterium]|nr:TolC family protein [Thermoanaerobaculia bacterium]
MKLCRLTLALVAALTLPASAQPGGAEPLRLGLAEALARAEAASANLARLSALERSALAQEDAAQAARKAEVGALASYTRRSNVPELVIAIPGSPPRTVFPNIPNNYRARVEGSIPLWTGGRLEAQLAAAGAGREAAGHRRTAGVNDLRAEVASAYWSLVTARATEQVLGEALAAYEAHRRDAENRRAVGMAAANEVLAVTVERQRAELARIEAASGARLAAANLARLLGLTPGTEIEPGEELAPPAAEPADAEALVADALGRRAERSVLASRLAVLDSRVRAEKSRHKPQVSLAAGLELGNPNRNILPPEEKWEDSWDVTVGLTWRLWDGGRTAAAVAELEAEAEALRHELADLDRRLGLEVLNRLEERATAEATIALAEANVEAARENRRVAAERYRAGVLASAELLDAEVALLSAGLDLTRARAARRLADAGLERALGGPR